MKKVISVLVITLFFCSCNESGDGIRLPEPQPIINGDRVLVPAGEVVLGNVPTGWGNYIPSTGENPVYVDSFYIDRYEVSNQQYAAYLNAAIDSGWVFYDGEDVFSDSIEQVIYLEVSSSECRISFIDSLGVFAAEQGYEDWPVVEISWYGAVAYAEFYGERLPTEAEWEKAARGTVDFFGEYDGVGVGYPYPWGDATPDENLANFGDSFGAPEDVQSYPQGMSWFGAFNLAGNVWEWTATVEGGNRVRRGGSYVSPADRLKTAAQFFSDPTLTDKTIGFRCAADP